MEIERRTIDEPVEVRDMGDGKLQMRGYAAVFNSLSEDLGGFREVIRHGSFTESLRENPDVVAYYNHGQSRDLPIGRTTAGTLRLFEDERGLRYEIDPPDHARDIVEAMKRGDVRHSSFAFSVRGTGGEVWRKEGDQTIRELRKLDLRDVSPVVNPAYRATDCAVAMRSLAAWQGQPEEKRLLATDLLPGTQVEWWIEDKAAGAAEKEMGVIVQVFTEGTAQIPGTSITQEVKAGDPIALVACFDSSTDEELGGDDGDSYALVALSELGVSDDSEPEGDEPLNETPDAAYQQQGADDGRSAEDGDSVELALARIRLAELRGK